MKSTMRSRPERWTLLAFLLIAVTGLVQTSSAAIVKSSQVDEENESDSEKLRSMHGMLMSIEAKLESMESRNQRNYDVEQLSKRMDAFQAKFSGIETTLEEHLNKMQEGEIRREIQKEPTIAELSKKMDSTAGKLFAKLGIFEAKSNIQLAGVGVKIQRMEYNLGRSIDETLEKILKIEEKNAQIMENLWTMHLEDSEKRHQQKHWDDQLAEAKSEKRNAAEESEAQRGELRTHGAAFNGTGGGKKDQREEQSSAPSIATAADTPMANAPCRVFWQNVSTTLGEALLIGDKKVAELDGDIEIYTRKVLNAYQELFKESKSTENNVNKVIDQGNHTQGLIRDGFRRLFQQMKPMATFEDVLQALQKKVLEMGNTIDTSFASLLVAQNTFISLLQRLVTKMDEKSSTFMAPLHSSNDVLWTALESHRKDVGRALHDLVWTVIKVGNETVEEVGRAIGQFQVHGICRCSQEDFGHNKPELTTTPKKHTVASVAASEGSLDLEIKNKPPIK